MDQIGSLSHLLVLLLLRLLKSPSQYAFNACPVHIDTTTKKEYHRMRRFFSRHSILNLRVSVGLCAEVALIEVVHAHEAVLPTGGVSYAARVHSKPKEMRSISAGSVEEHSQGRTC